jgi:16S rRNA (guanine966-N2)-methyltransferase
LKISVGNLKNKRLKAVKGNFVRPTSSKVKQALFNILSEKISDALVLDLYAGTGAVGIELLSLGAAEAFFVEHNRVAVNMIKRNLEQTGVGLQARIYKMKVLDALVRLQKRKKRFDLIFVDPPYDISVADVLFNISEQNILAEQGIVILEHSKLFEYNDKYDELFLYKRKRYGTTLLSFYRKN